MVDDDSIIFLEEDDTINEETEQERDPLADVPLEKLAEALRSRSPNAKIVFGEPEPEPVAEPEPDAVKKWEEDLLSKAEVRIQAKQFETNKGIYLNSVMNELKAKYPNVPDKKFDELRKGAAQLSGDQFMQAWANDGFDTALMSMVGKAVLKGEFKVETKKRSEASPVGGGGADEEDRLPLTDASRARKAYAEGKLGVKFTDREWKESHGG